MIDNKKYIFDNPKNVKLLIRALYACCFILFAMDLIVHRHIYHPWEEFIGFYAFYGCLACVVLVLLAREMRKVVMRDENYYDIKDLSADDDTSKVENKKEDKLMTGEKVDG
jgi:amino acid permease